MIAAVKFLLAVATIGAYSFTSALLTGSVFTRYASSMQQRSSSVVLNQALGKGDIAEILKEKTGLNKKDIELMLTAFSQTVQQEVLVKGNEIRLREFGTFKQKKSAARLGRNPRTGEDLQILGSTSVAFSVSSVLKCKDGSEVEAIKGASVDEKEKKPKAAKKAVKETNEE